MSAGTSTGLMAFSAWVRETDDHAAHHLEVLERVQSLLDQPADESDAECRKMAAKLERWRYQFLNEHAQGVSERGERFVAALERTARILRGSGPLEPRQTRHAVVDPMVDLPTFGEALRALRPS